MRIYVVLLAVMMAGVVRADLPDGLYAEFDTSMGSFTCRLDYAEAPLTCANFIGLAEGAQAWIDPDNGAVRHDPFYSNRIFHRVIDGFMIQGGCPLGNGTSGPGYAFPDEFVPVAAHYEHAGTLVMANSGSDSNGSQFFVTMVPHPYLDPGLYMVFGDVVDGIGVVVNIGKVATTADRPDVDVVIDQVKILRIGMDAIGFDAEGQPLPEVSPMNLAMTNTPSSLHLVAGITNQCMVSVHSSTNLMVWGPYEQSYWPTTGGMELLSVSTELPTQFFRAAKIYYPQAITTFSGLDGRTLTFTQGANVLVFSPEAGSVGTCDIAGTPDTLTYWEEWTSEPYVGRVVFQPSGINALQFLLDWDGECKGYQYSGSSWQYIGIWELDLVPE